MENENIVLLKHHNLNIKYDNSFYLNQTDNHDLSDYIIIDVTSRVERNKEFMKLHPNFPKDISPMYIGPVVSSDNVVANIFEIFWQCGKVYPCHDNNGKPNEEYFKWRNDFYAQTICTKDLMRHTCKSLLSITIFSKFKSSKLFIFISLAGNSKPFDKQNDFSFLK